MKTVQAFLRPRLRVWREVVWRPWAWVIGGLYAAAQLYQWFKGEWLPPDAQERLRLPKILPPLPWWTWTIGWLVLCLVVILEGAYRTVTSREEKFAEQAAAARAKELAQPRLKVIFDEKCLDCFEQSLGYVRVGVWNDGATATDVKIYLTALNGPGATKGATFGKLQLPWVGVRREGIVIHKSIESGHHHADLAYVATVEKDMYEVVQGDHFELLVETTTGAISKALKQSGQLVAILTVEATNIKPVIVKVVLDPRQFPPIMQVSADIAQLSGS